MTETEKQILRSVRRRINKLSNSEYGAEIDDETIHASQIGYCERGMFTSKFSLRQAPSWLDKVFRTGTMYHRAIEADLMIDLEDVGMAHMAELEKPLSIEQDVGDRTIHVIGHADVVTERAIIDWKTVGSSSWSDIVDGPKNHHRAQMQAYMHAADVEAAFLHYIEKSKPNNRYEPNVDDARQLTHGVERDPHELAEHLEKVRRVMNMSEMVLEALDQYDEDHTIEAVHRLYRDGQLGIPFDKCDEDEDCFMCDKEQLIPAARGGDSDE